MATLAAPGGRAICNFPSHAWATLPRVHLTEGILDILEGSLGQCSWAPHCTKAGVTAHSAICRNGAWEPITIYVTALRVVPPGGGIAAALNFSLSRANGKGLCHEDRSFRYSVTNEQSHSLTKHLSSTSCLAGSWTRN